jgi:predicted Zn-dependent peptidase
MLSAIPSSECPPLVSCEYAPAFNFCEKQIEQNHIVLGFPGLHINRDYQFAYTVMSSILGAGMSSRLYQNVREENGRCYSIYSFTTSHRDTGVAGIYTALGPDTEKKALELIREVVELYIKEGPTETELSRAREQLKANVIMSEESTMYRSLGIGQSVLNFGDALEMDEVIKRIDAVTRDAVLEIAARVTDFNRISLSVVGRPGDETGYRELLG